MKTIFNLIASLELPFDLVNTSQQYAIDFHWLYILSWIICTIYEWIIQAIFSKDAADIWAHDKNSEI
jgi:hypothetical protein